MPGGQEQIQLIDALEQHSSLYELCLELPKLAESLDQNQTLKDNEFVVVETVTALRRDPRNGWKMCELLHSMPRSVIRSVIQGTVAYDSFHNKADWFAIPSKAEGKVAGVYVVGLSLAYRQGKFLNIKEMEDLISGIEKYIKGFRALAKHWRDVADKKVVYGDTSQLSNDERRALAWVGKVDGDFQKLSSTKQGFRPRYITKVEELPSMEALVRNYRRMCDTTLDPSRRVQMHQSPIYVGCSTDLRERTSCYTRNSLTGLNKPLGLTVAVLKVKGFAVIKTVRVALRIWERHQLPLAEQLVVTIGGSLVYQHGFNAAEAGGTGPYTATNLETLDASKRLLMSRKAHMCINLMKTVAELERRVEFLQDMDELQAEVEELTESVQTFERELDGLPLEPGWDSAVEEMTDILKRMQLEVQEAINILQQWELILEINRKFID
ncbi:hypothetical protein ACJZ2D_016239 [Fusarium nematophilum]